MVCTLSHGMKYKLHLSWLHDTGANSYCDGEVHCLPAGTMFLLEIYKRVENIRLLNYPATTKKGDVAKYSGGVRSIGMDGRLQSYWVPDFHRDQWSTWCGIRKFCKNCIVSPEFHVWSIWDSVGEGIFCVPMVSWTKSKFT